METIAKRVIVISIENEMDLDESAAEVCYVLEGVAVMATINIEFKLDEVVL